MVEIKEKDPQLGVDGRLLSEGPSHLGVDNVQFWCKHARELERPHVSKAKRFLEFDCVRYVGEENEYDQKGSFVVLPLNSDESAVDVETGVVFQKRPYPKDYNSTVYTIVKNDGKFICNCQGWTFRERQGRGGRDGCSCSHVLALFFAFKIGRFRR